MVEPRSRSIGNADRPQGHLGFESTLWATADKLRGNLHAAEYKHVVLGLIFLRCFLSEFASAEGNLGLEPAGSLHRELPDTDLPLAVTA